MPEWMKALIYITVMWSGVVAGMLLANKLKREVRKLLWGKKC